VELLKVLAEIESAGTMQEWRERVIKSHAEVAARKAIKQAAAPRRVVKADKVAA
jgi:hypothetical protein